MKTLKSKLSAVLSMFVATSLLAGCSNFQNTPSTVNNNPILTTQFYKALLVPVVIANKRYTFWVDTGSSLTIIDPKIADLITTQLNHQQIPDIYRRNLETVHTVSGKLEQQEFKLYKPLAMQIGNKVIHDHDLWLGVKLDKLTEALGVEISGIIGIDTFRQLNWLVDNRSNKLFIYDYAPSADKFNQCIGYTDDHNRAPVLALKHLDENIGLYVDTGASDSYFGMEFITFLQQKTKSSFKAPNSHLNLELDEMRQKDSYIIKDLIFEGMPLGELEVSGSENELYALGMSFFSRFERYAFLPNKMMFCYDAKTIESSWKQPVRQIYVRYFNDHIEFFYNDEKLEALGLKNGDIVLEANGRRYKPAEIQKLSGLIENTPKGKLTIKIQRGDKIKTLKI